MDDKAVSARDFDTGRKESGLSMCMVGRHSLGIHFGQQIVLANRRMCCVQGSATSRTPPLPLSRISAIVVRSAFDFRDTRKNGLAGPVTCAYQAGSQRIGFKHTSCV